MTGTATKPWQSGNILPNLNTCENGWLFFSENLRIIALKLHELTRFASSNQSIYFNFWHSVGRPLWCWHLFFVFVFCWASVVMLTFWHFCWQSPLTPATRQWKINFYEWSYAIPIRINYKVIHHILTYGKIILPMIILIHITSDYSYIHDYPMIILIFMIIPWLFLYIYKLFMIDDWWYASLLTMAVTIL